MMSHNNEHIIQVEALHTQFGAHIVHHDVNLCVHRGEVLTLVGGSGSGKTTLLRQILGLEQPTQGKVYLFGQTREQCNTDQLRRIRNRCGVLFQQGALFSALTVFDNVALPLRELRHFNEKTIYDIVMAKLASVAIAPEHAYKMPADLSGGMVKRVALARALVLDPELLFLDEPTAGLDPELSQSFVQLILSLRREMNLSVVMITHDLDSLIALSDRIAVLADQKIVITGTLAQVCQYTHPFINNFFKSALTKSPMNNKEDTWKTVPMPL